MTQPDTTRFDIYNRQVADANESAKQNTRDQLDSKVIQGSMSVVGTFAQATGMGLLKDKHQKNLQSVAVVTKLAVSSFTLAKDVLTRAFKTEAKLPSFGSKDADKTLDAAKAPAIADVGTNNAEAANSSAFKNTGTMG